MSAKRSSSDAPTGNRSAVSVRLLTVKRSHCDALIRRAQLAAAGGGGSGGSTGGGAGTAAASTPLTPSQRSALKRSPRAGAAPLQVGNQVVHPGVVRVDVASALNALPTPLLAILAFLLACALALAGGAIRNHVRAHRTV
jgi:hypothetical protein